VRQQTKIALGLTVSALALLDLQAGRAAAQTTPPATVQEVIVTAQKRAQNIKDVPISITAVSGATLARQGFVNFNDIAAVAPNMTSLQLGDSRTSTMTIRGVTSQQVNIGQQASLGVFVDGVFMARTGMGATQDFLDIDRIEVLRGPQGTLFGMNTAGGLVDIITRKPDLNQFGGNVDVSYGSYDDLRLRGLITGPILPDVLGFSLGAYSDSHDGYTYDPVNHSHVDNLKKEGARAKLEYSKDNVDATLTADYQHETSLCCAAVISKLDPGANVFGVPVTGPPGYPYSRETIQDTNNSNSNSGGGVSAEINWRFNGFTLTSLASARTWQADPVSDIDSLPEDFLDGFTIHQSHQQVSEELRLASPSGQKLEYVAGLFYFYRHSTEYDYLPFGSAASFLTVPGTNGATTNYGSVDDSSYAAFGHADYHWTDKLTTSAGLRYTQEPQTAYFSQNSNNFAYPTLGVTRQNRNDGALTWQVDLSYKWTPEVTTYASIARGFKPGGFDMTRLQSYSDFQFSPETNTNYEVGLKSNLLDHRLSIDAALYWTDYNNFQALSFDGLNIITRNAGAFISRGVELQATARPIHGLSLTAAGSYDDAHYVSFPDGQCLPGVTGPCNLSGAPLAGAPRWTFNGSAEYDHPVAANWDGFVRFDYVYKSGMYFAESLDPGTYQPGYGVVNGRIGLNDHNGLRVSLFATNLTAAKYMSFIYNSPLATGVYVGYVGAPRVIGVDLGKSF
jgi:iron complex outermembrane receptor protein